MQLSQERDNVRHLSLQKEIELKELQMRIDKSVCHFTPGLLDRFSFDCSQLQEHSKTREALVGAETSKKHLEERVEELTRQQQGNEEKLAVYERRSSGSNGAGPSSYSDLTREQQLEAEVAELRYALVF